MNVLDWKAEQVADWLRGLEDTVYPYAHFFLNNDVTGQVKAHQIALSPNRSSLFPRSTLSLFGTDSPIIIFVSSFHLSRSP